MCYLTKCEKCGKTTWVGCGQHIKQLTSLVSEQDKCKCVKWTL